VPEKTGPSKNVPPRALLLRETDEGKPEFLQPKKAPPNKLHLNLRRGKKSTYWERKSIPEGKGSKVFLLSLNSEKPTYVGEGVYLSKLPQSEGKKSSKKRRTKRVLTQKKKKKSQLQGKKKGPRRPEILKDLLRKKRTTVLQSKKGRGSAGKNGSTPRKNLKKGGTPKGGKCGPNRGGPQKTLSYVTQRGGGKKTCFSGGKEATLYEEEGPFLDTSLYGGEKALLERGIWGGAPYLMKRGGREAHHLYLKGGVLKRKKNIPSKKTLKKTARGEKKLAADTGGTLKEGSLMTSSKRGVTAGKLAASHRSRRERGGNSGRRSNTEILTRPGS